MIRLRWFDLRDFERDGRFYERLGIRMFKRFATGGDYWNKRRRRSAPDFKNVRDVGSAVEWEARTRSNELLHMGSLAIGLTILGWLGWRGEFVWMVAVGFGVLVWDIYPIMLQRYTRARIWRIKSMVQRRNQRASPSAR